MKKFQLKRSKWAIALGSAVLMLGITVLSAAGVLIWFGVWSSEKNVDDSLLPTASALPTFLDKNGIEIPYNTSAYLSPDEITPNVKNAFVALEDKRFYSHSGYDAIRIAGATLNNLKAGKAVEGGSTITQQLVKNTHLTAQKTVSRKLNEIAIATKLEEKYSKDEILSMYLSVIYFGGGNYGIKDAAKSYFAKSPTELTLSEAATLAGILKNPSKYSPKNSISAATERRNLVLSVMQNEGYITAEEAESAKKEKIKLAQPEEQTNNSEYYIEKVIGEVTSILGITRFQLNNSALTIMTNLDTELQNKLALEAKNVQNFENSEIDCSAIVINNADGKVLAHHSSLSYEVSRQIGSTMKPFSVYAPALEEGSITLATSIVDEPTDFGGWSPSNFQDIYYGTTTPRLALIKSMNTVAVKVANYVGAEKSFDYASKFGFSLSDEDKNLTLALGATKKGNSPLSVCGAYSTLARGGDYIKPSYVNAIVQSGRKIYTADNPKTSVISSKTAYLVTDCLKDCVKNGTAKGLSSLNMDIAAKTGTVGNQNGNTDAWSASYSTDYSVVVWHGTGKMSENGGGYPTHHAKEIWSALYQDGTKPNEFARPNGIVERAVDSYSTSKNKVLTFALPSTPQKYVNTELFDEEKLPESGKSHFADVIPEYYVALGDNVGGVSITLPVNELYYYELYRKDILGMRLIDSVDGVEYAVGAANGVLNYNFTDRPLSIGRPVEYTVRIYLNDDVLGRLLLGEETKQIIPKWFS